MTTVKYFTAPSFHIVFRDSAGKPATNGTVNFYKATAHATPKDVYEDKNGSVAFAQPINLNAAGIIANAGGTPKPVYYADDEDYYVVVKDSDGNTIQTVDNWNSAVADSGTPSTTDTIFDNYYLGSQFRFPVKTSFSSAASELPVGDTLIANPNWYFSRNNTNSTLTITFTEFTLGQTTVPFNPKYYLAYNCSSVAGSGETEKDINFRINDVITFSGQTIVVSFWAKSSTLQQIQLRYKQNFGTGGAPSSEVDQGVENFTLTASWTQYTKSFTLPSVSGKTLGSNGDDFLELAIRLKLDGTGTADLSNFQWNEGSTLLEYQYKTFEKDAIDKRALTLPDPTANDLFGKIKWDGEKFIIDNQTGKVEAFLLGTVPEGYLELNGATLIRTAKIGGTTITGQRLYDAWQNDASIANGNAFGYGSDGFYPMIYSDTVNFTMTNKSNTTNWSDNNTTFTFTQIRDSLSIDATALLTFYPLLHNAAASKFVKSIIFRTRNVANGAVADATMGTLGGGLTITVIQQGAAAAKEITDFQVLMVGDLQAAAGQYFTIDSTVTAYYIWFKVDNAGADPAPGGRTGKLVRINSSDSRFEIASKIKAVLDSTSEFTVTFPVSIQLTNDSDGVVAASTIGTTTFHVTTVIAGAANNPNITNIEPTDASVLVGGEYWTFDTTTTAYYIWYSVDGTGVDPAVVGRTGVKVSLKSTDTQFLVSMRTKQALDNLESVEITCKAASTLTGGEYFNANNVSTNFYVWYDKDNGSTDPAPGGKTGIEVDIAAADTAAQVAEKTRKAVSSYFFVIPDARGYFFRNWNHSSANEIDALIRKDRGDGTFGDIVGSYQEYDVGSHILLPAYGGSGFTIQGAGAGASPVGAGAVTCASTDNIGVADTKPQNISILYAIKY